MTLDNNIEVVRAINRNTDELRRITAELKRLGVSAKDTGSALVTVLRLTEPAKDVTTFGPDEFEAKWGERPAGFENEDG